MPAKKTEKKNKDEKSFEVSVKRLEQIVAEMEEGALSLDDMIARFEEGQALIKACSAKLNEVEKKVEKIISRGGKSETVPFDEEEEEDDAGEEEEPEDDGDPELF